MATAEVSATINAARATAASSNLIGGTSANVTAADTAAGTVVTDNTTTLTAIDAFAAAIIAITGDTYVAHQFVFGGATGLTHAQVATNFALLNTAITDFLAAQTAAVAAKTATAAAKTSATAINADMTLYIGSVANVADMNKLRNGLRRIEDTIAGSNLLAAGSPTPRSP